MEESQVARQDSRLLGTALATVSVLPDMFKNEL